MCAHAQVRVQLLVVSSLLPWGGPRVGLWPSLERLSINLMACEDPASSEQYYPLGRGPELKQKGEIRLGTWSKHGACIHFFLLLTTVVMWQSALTTLASLSMGCHLELWAGINPCSPLHCFWGATETKPGPWGAANWPWKSNSKQKGGHMIQWLCLAVFSTFIPRSQPSSGYHLCHRARKSSP